MHNMQKWVGGWGRGVGGAGEGVVGERLRSGERWGGGRFATSSACSSFLKFSKYCCENINDSNPAKKSKQYFHRQKLKKNHFTLEIARVRPIFDRELNFRVHI